MPPGWLSWSAIFPELAPRPPSLFDQVSLRRTAKAALSSLLASLVSTSVVTWWPTVHSGWWLPAPDSCLDQTCYLYWSMPELCAVYNSPLQTWCQSYIWWLWPAALHKISRTCQESIKESLSQYLDGRRLSYYNFTSRFPGQCEEQRLSHKAAFPSPDECWNRCPTSKIRCWFHDHIISAKCVG